MPTLTDSTIQEIGAIACENGCRLLAVERTGAGKFSVLRIVLERSDGSPVSIAECESVSRAASTLLDVSDEIAHRYTLEVTSPGLDRKLYSIEDAARFVGRRVRVKTETPVEPKTEASAAPRAPLPAKNFAGTLRAIEGDVLTVVDEENRKIYNVRFGDIRLARLDFEWPERGRRVSPR